MPRSPRHRIHDRRVDALLGFLLGLGAPAGWILLRIVFTEHAWLSSWFKNEFFQFGHFYLYITIGCVLVFTLFGYFLGRHSDDVIDESEAVKSTLDQVNVLAVTDALTGLHNARYLHDHLILELESAKRYETPLTCLMLDIDDFKIINDTYGHPFGDTVLTTLAKTLRQCVRRVDILGRLGGEEFLIVMPHTSSETAVMIAERIRQAVQRWPFAIETANVPVTVSIGVACFPTHEITDKSGLLKAADEALYEAKRTGKNRSVIFKEASRPVSQATVE